MKKAHKDKTSLDTYREIRKPMPKPALAHENNKNNKKKHMPQADYKNIPVDNDSLDNFDDFDPEDLNF